MIKPQRSARVWVLVLSLAAVLVSVSIFVGIHETSKGATYRPHLVPTRIDGRWRVETLKSLTDLLVARPGELPFFLSPATDPAILPVADASLALRFFGDPGGLATQSFTDRFFSHSIGLYHERKGAPVSPLIVTSTVLTLYREMGWKLPRGRLEQLLAGLSRRLTAGGGFGLQDAGDVGGDRLVGTVFGFRILQDLLRLSDAAAHAGPVSHLMTSARPGWLCQFNFRESAANLVIDIGASLEIAQLSGAPCRLSSKGLVAARSATVKLAESLGDVSQLADPVLLEFASDLSRMDRAGWADDRSVKAFVASCLGRLTAPRTPDALGLPSPVENVAGLADLESQLGVRTVLSATEVAGLQRIVRWWGTLPDQVAWSDPQNTVMGLQLLGWLSATRTSSWLPGDFATTFAGALRNAFPGSVVSRLQLATGMDPAASGGDLALAISRKGPKDLFGMDVTADAIWTAGCPALAAPWLDSAVASLVGARAMLARRAPLPAVEEISAILWVYGKCRNDLSTVGLKEDMIARLAKLQSNTIAFMAPGVPPSITSAWMGLEAACALGRPPAVSADALVSLEPISGPSLRPPYFAAADAYAFARSMEIASSGCGSTPWWSASGREGPST
jgi:hypothetical protein